MPDPRPADPVVDDAIHAATSYRHLGQALVGVLTVVPLATVATSILKTPENGFDYWKLGLGLVLMVISVAAAIALVTFVRAPIKLEDRDLQDFEMSRIIGSRYSDYQALLQLIHDLVRTRNRSPTSNTELQHALEIRARIYQLKTADKMRDKLLSWTEDAFSATVVMFVVALVAGAAGIGFLAVAPKTKAAEKQEIKLVDVTLTADGQKALGCDRPTFSALKVGGDDKTPLVVPTDAVCAKGRLLKLSIGEAAPLAKSVKAVEVSTATVPKPSPPAPTTTG